MKKTKSFTVKRSRWLRGLSVNSRLLNRNNKMCCLGFLIKEYGATDEEILGEGCPIDVPNLNWPSGTFTNNRYGHSLIIHDILRINDSSEITDVEREFQLIDKFSQLDITVSFED